MKYYGCIVYSVMKLPSIIVLFLICFTCFTQDVYSFERNDTVGLKLPFTGTDVARKYINYEFGLSGINSVCIAEGDTVCDVFIGNEKGQSLSTRIRKEPILKWAFEYMENELKGCRTVSNDEYPPAYFQLSLFNDNHRIIAASSSLQIEDNKDLEAKLEELKTFMINLWIAGTVNGNNDMENKN